MEKLTAKQQKIYDYIQTFSAEHGYPPSVREIGAAMGLKSPSTVHFHLKGLEEAGVIIKAEGKTRAITLSGTGRPVAEEQDPHADQIPVVGSVAAGSPILAEECIEDYLTFDTTAERDGMELIAVVMKSPTSAQRFEDAKALLDYGFANYTLARVYPDVPLAPVEVLLGTTAQVQPQLERECSLLVRKGEEGLISTQIQLAQDLEAPVERGQKLGQMSGTPSPSSPPSRWTASPFPASLERCFSGC